MVQLKLTLKSKKPSNVYALNGKAYRLQPGQNTLNLEYDDYVSLAKALGIKPVDKDASQNKNSARQEPVKKVEDKLADIKQDAPLPASEPEPLPESEPEPIHEQAPGSEPEHIPESESEPDADDSNESTDNADEDNNDAKGIDYESWSYTKLKAEYKRITGRNCKLKKAEVIQFLQEHN